MNNHSLIDETKSIINQTAESLVNRPTNNFQNDLGDLSGNQPLNLQQPLVDEIVQPQIEQLNEQTNQANKLDNDDANNERRLNGERSNADLMNGEQQTVEQHDVRQPNIIRVPINPGDSNFRTVTLKLLPPINGGPKPSNTSNLVLKLKPRSDDLVEEPVVKTGTTKPMIQTITPMRPVNVQTVSSTTTTTTPKLIIKPLKPPTTESSNKSNHKSNASNAKSTDQHIEKLKTCIKTGCDKRSVKSDEWDYEYCSSECLIKHCKEVFNSWVESRSMAK